MSEITADNELTRVTARRFLQLLVFASLAPIGFFLIAYPVLPARMTESSYQLLIFLSIAHVPITGFFWFDDRYRAHMNANPKTYYLTPALIIAACAFVPVTFGQAGANYLFLIYFAWLLWHYGKQNWGILCLFSIGTKSPMPTKLERYICNAAPVFGVMGAAASLSQASSFASILPALYWTGLAGSIAVAAATLYVVGQQLNKGTDRIRIAMTAIAGWFFLPTFLNAEFGVTSYATAHAVQYFVMMYALAADRKQRATVVRLIVITVLAVAGYFFANSFNNSALWGSAVLVGAAIGTGITMSHFFLDSRLWRLREPFQRGAVKESFDFLFR